MRPNFLVKTKKQTIARARIKYRNKDYQGSLLEWNDLLDRKNDHALGLMGKFDCLLKIGDISEALVVGEYACEVNLDSTATQNNYACLLMDERDFKRAAVYFENAQALQPETIIFSFNAGLANYHCQRFDKAEGHFTRVLQMDPQHDRAMEFLSLIYLFYGFNQRVINLSSRIAFLKAMHATATQRKVFCQLSDLSITDEERALDVNIWQVQYASKYQRNSFPELKKDLSTKKRLGWIICEYSMPELVRFLPAFYPFLENHDAELVGFASKSVLGSYAESVESIFDEFHICEGDGLKEFNQMVVNNGVDILFNTVGQVPNNLLFLFEHRLALTQISWPFSVTRTGLKSIEYRVVTKTLYPELPEIDGDALKYLESGLVPYSPPKHAIDVNELPALSRNHITFGYCGELYQLNDETLACWAQILHAVTDAKLLIANKYFPSDLLENNFYQNFEELGIDPKRILFRTYDSILDTSLSIYHQIDIVLNPFPFSNKLTIIDALWMGCPVVALTTTHRCTLIGIQCLTSANHSEYISENQSAYKNIAISLTNNLMALAEIRANLRATTGLSSIVQSSSIVNELFTLFVTD